MRTMTMTFNGTPVTLNLITEGGYSSEYMTRTASEEYRLKVRHSKEKATKGGKALDRHNVELTVRTFGTPSAPESTTQTYFVVRSDPDTNGVWSSHVAKALFALGSAKISDLVAWGSDFTTGGNADDGDGDDGDDGGMPPIG